jgi:segregation and condensation protein A
MAETTFPSLRMALNHALSGIRSRFGRVATPGRQERPKRAEVDIFLARLEEVLGFELQASEPAPQSQERETESAVNAAEVLEPVSLAVSSPLADLIDQPAVKPKPKRKAGAKAASPKATVVKAAEENVAIGTRRTGKPAPRRKSNKQKSAVDPKTPAPVLVAQAEMDDKTTSPRQDPAEIPLKPARSKRQGVGPQSILVSTALVHVPRLKPAPPAKGYRAGHPPPALLGAAQAATPVHGHAPQQIQAQTLADQPPARQKKAGEDESPFSVSVGQVYDGPLDLLLDLIRRQDIDIYDIPIATLTAQFLSYVNQLKATDVDVAGEFIYIASLLIHIKSKMLLPRSPSGPEDAAEDPRRELVERLLEHERFKNAAQMLQQKQMLESATWSNPGFREFQDDAAAEPEIAADTTDLVRIFRDILERARKMPVLDLQEDSVTVGQMIQFLARRLSIEDKPVALRKLLSHTRSERALVAMFLALLELVRLQAVLLRQDRAFSDIFIKKHTGFDAIMNDGVANALDDWR